MKAGRELDALIAEKVMDGKRCPNCTDGLPECGFHPHYSTDIAAAWEVVGKLKDSHPRFMLMRYEMTFGARKFESCFDTMPQQPGDLCDTAPHAICLAALKAVGY